uniref:Uncharacterized protein n=1 Tax=Anguilla anguilla TaxID=7936 RepID=A0A0E9WD16_ANGAN
MLIGCLVGRLHIFFQNNIKPIEYGLMNKRDIRVS